MRRRTIRILAMVLTVVMLVCQAGLTVRSEADTGALQPAEQETVGSGEIAAGNGGVLESDMPADPPAGDAPLAPEEDMQPEVSQPENGGDSSGDAVVQGPEAMEEPDQAPSQGAPGAFDGPSFDGEMTPAPSETAEPMQSPEPTQSPEAAEEPEVTEAPEVTEEPEPTEEPEAVPSGTPFGEGMLAFDSEEEALAYLRSLADDEYGIMPIGELSDAVPSQYFRFSIYKANESGSPDAYKDFADLKASDKYTVTTDNSWSGPNGGDVQGDSVTTLNYPAITGYKISSIRVNGTIIYHLGMYEVEGNQYVHFTAVSTKGRMTTVVLTNKTYTTAPFEVRYVPAEYDITYQVVVGRDEKNGEDSTFGWDAIFGTNRAKTTVDHWASVDVTIPAGYTGRVYVYETGTVFADTAEVYPQEETGDRHYPLGAEPVYTYDGDTNTINIDTTRGPGSYTMTGTYLVGSSLEGVSAPQTVRVELEKKTEITFHADVWSNYLVGETSTANKVNVPGGSWTVTKPLSADDGSGDFEWMFAITTYNDHNGSPIDDAELRTLEINGASIPVPFVSATRVTADTETDLPSGAHVKITATWTNNHPSYTISITDATRDVWITGGSMNTGFDNTYKELIVSGLYGVNVQVWTGSGSTADGRWTEVAAGDTFCTGYSWGRYEEQDQYGDAGFLYHMTGGSDAGGQSGNVRFQLQEGFTFAGGAANLDGAADSPTVRLVDKYGDAKNSSAGGDGVTDLAVSGPDSEGWYYVTLQSPYGGTAASATADGTTDAYLLEVRAYPEQYVIVYRDGVENGSALNPDVTGTVDDTQMPTYDNPDYPHVDNNGGNYYQIQGGRDACP